MSSAPYHFKFQLSDWTLFSWQRQLQVRGYVLGTVPDPTPPMLQPGSDGLLFRSIPLTAGTSALTPVELPAVSRVKHDGQAMLRYELQRFPRHYIDMGGKDFDGYKGKFSGKTRSTLTRRVKKFTEACGGTLRWERFARPEELPRFWQLARDVSAKTYQERLLDAGLPDSASYQQQALQWAAQDRLRAFLLFDGERPVSYLFCPVRDGVVEYAYLGYDPAYKQLSVGTVLQWLALESLFDERRYRYFDFTEGDSDHKRLFGTDHLPCANVVLLRPTLANRMLVHSHWRFTQGSNALGQWAERHGLKRRIKHWLRFGHAA